MNEPRSTPLAAAFRCAFAGLGHLVRSQRNARIHVAATAGVVLLAIGLRLGRLEWALLIFAIGLVWTAEALNTALEAAIDLAHPEVHPLARISKDVGAGAVLVSAVTAAAIGLLVLGPPLLTLLSSGR
jgi:diacylglycerol kinase